MCDVLVFAGTTEGYEITWFLQKHGVPVHMCVATEYGSERLKEDGCLTISHERLDQAQMEALILRKGVSLVIDATHPYAVVVTENIQKACQAVGVSYQRVLRASQKVEERKGVVPVDSVEAAVAYLEGEEGDILLTTGSKELHKFTALTRYEERIYARVLSISEVVSECARLGFQGKHLICMQGPFSLELNKAMLRQYGCKFLVTKETGKSGGFEEKYKAAREAGATLVVIGRPGEETGISVEECKDILGRKYGIPKTETVPSVDNPESESLECGEDTSQITLVGIGMGSEATMTVEGRKACEEADCIIGGRRLVDAVLHTGQVACYEYAADKIGDYIASHPEYRKVVVALSGDVGFYSGAKKLLQVLGENVRIICGISSLVYFMSRIRQSWEDAVILSTHGKSCNLIHYIKSNDKTFAILGSREGVAQLAGKLLDYGMEDVIMYVGEELSYPREKIHSGHPADYREYEANPLSVVCVINPHARQAPCHLKDDEFIRGKVPMTKEEVRSLSVDKLALTRDAICYDVGAGTGSVSMEMALNAWDGMVYAVEKKPEAVELIRRNKKALAMDNLEVVEGLAPEALADLPAPTHVFVGGSSGNLYEIMKVILEKNPKVQAVINCITLETVAESLRCLKELPLGEVQIVQASIAKSRELGAYHLMTGENPIYIISCKGVCASSVPNI